MLVLIISDLFRIQFYGRNMKVIISYNCLMEQKRGIFFSFLNFYRSIVALQWCISFLLYSKANKLYVYIYPLYFWISFPFRSPEYWVAFPVLYSRFSLVMYFIHSINSGYMSIPIFPFIPYPFPLLGIPMFVLYTWGTYIMCEM